MALDSKHHRPQHRPPQWHQSHHTRGWFRLSLRQYCHVTVHSFEWPGGGVLSDHLRSLTNNATDREGGELCFTILDLRTLPYNVSNAYQESDAGDCSNALGSECVQAYLSSLSGRSGQCATPRGPNSIPACASTLATVSCFGSFTASKSTTHTVLRVFTNQCRPRQQHLLHLLKLHRPQQVSHSQRRRFLLPLHRQPARWQQHFLRGSGAGVTGGRDQWCCEGDDVSES